MVTDPDCECSWMDWDPARPLPRQPYPERFGPGSHTRTRHDPRTGRCSGTTSYGTPCECPSFVELTDDDPEES